MMKDKKKGSEINWKSYLQEFFANQAKTSKGTSTSYLAGALMAMVNSHTRAIPHLRRAVRRADGQSNVGWKIGTREALAQSLLEHGDLGEKFKAQSMLLEAQQMAEKLANGKFSDGVFARQAQLLESRLIHQTPGIRSRYT